MTKKAVSWDDVALALPAVVMTKLLATFDALGAAAAVTTTSIGAATPASVTAAVAALVNAAPATMDTLGEIAAIIASDESAAAALLTAVGTKATTAALTAETSRAQGVEAANTAAIAAEAVTARAAEAAKADPASVAAAIAVQATSDSSTYARIVSGLLAGSGNAVANLAILNAATASLGTPGGTIIINTPGEYQISDSWNWDAENMHLHLGAGVHLFTAAATALGGAVLFVGYLGGGTALTPQRNSATLSGSGKITGWLGGANENATGAVRVKRFTVLPGLTLEGGNKAITTQYGVDDVNISGISIPTAGYRAVSIEQQGGAIRAVVRDIKVGVSGDVAVGVTGDRVLVENISIDTAFNSGTPGSAAAVQVYARDGGTLSMARVSDITITEAGTGKGVLISSATGVAKMSNIKIGHSGGNATEFFNCTGLSVAEDVNAPSSLTTVASTGTTSTVVLRAADPLESSGLVSGESALPRQLINSTGISMTSGTIRLTYFTARKSETVNNVRVLCGTTAAGATPTLIRVGIYTVANNGDLTLVASTASDTTLLAAANTAYTKALSAPYAKVAGTRYALGLIVVTAAALPTMGGNSVIGGLGSEAGQTPKLCASFAAQTDLTTPITNAQAAGSTAGPYIAITP